jgi:hypothetical protein
MFVTAAIAQTRLVTEEMMVKSPDPGIEIYVRNKRPADMGTFRPERTVLYVHGATYPASTAFDLQLGGMSWMDYTPRAATTFTFSICAAMGNPHARRKCRKIRRRTHQSCVATLR